MSGAGRRLEYYTAVSESSWSKHWPMGHPGPTSQIVRTHFHIQDHGPRWAVSDEMRKDRAHAKRVLEVVKSTMVAVRERRLSRRVVWRVCGQTDAYAGTDATIVSQSGRRPANARRTLSSAAVVSRDSSRLLTSSRSSKQGPFTLAPIDWLSRTWWKPRRDRDMTFCSWDGEMSRGRQTSYESLIDHGTVAIVAE